jgi:plasmid stability protein
MAQLIVCTIDDEDNHLVEVRAARHGWSMEEEVRQILRSAVSEEDSSQRKLGSRIAARFAGVGLTEPLVELRGHTIEPMGFSS